MDKRNNDIWKGQALNIAKDELLNAGKTMMDLNILFKRAEQIYYKGLKCGFLELELPKGTKEKCDWVECKKCHQLADRAHYERCRCGEPIPPKE